MGSINYLVGDATKPSIEGNKIITHCCNDKGAWGAGFVLSLSKRWKEPEQMYRMWSTGKDTSVEFKLSATQVVNVEHGIWVANIIGQHGYGSKKDADYPFIRYEAIESGLLAINQLASHLNATVHMPRIGCGLAGGDWQKIEEIIKKCLKCDVYVYDLA